MPLHLLRHQDSGDQQGEHEDHRRYGVVDRADAPLVPSPTGEMGSPVGADEPGIDKADEQDEQPDARVIASLSCMGTASATGGETAGRQCHDDQAVDDHEAHWPRAR